jgi:hypothetical protein
MKESMRDYFKKKTDAIDGKKEGSEEKFVAQILHKF